MEDSRIIELYESRDQQAISQSDIKYGGYCYSVGYNILGVREAGYEPGHGGVRERNLAQGMELHSAPEAQNAVGIFRADNKKYRI